MKNAGSIWTCGFLFGSANTTTLYCVPISPNEFENSKSDGNDMRQFCPVTGYQTNISQEKYEATHFRNGVVKQPGVKKEETERMKMRRQSMAAAAGMFMPGCFGGVFHSPAGPSILQTPVDLPHFHRKRECQAGCSELWPRSGAAGCWCR